MSRGRFSRLQDGDYRPRRTPAYRPTGHMEARKEGEGGCASREQQTRPTLRDIARLCINTFRAFYAGEVGARAAAAPATSSRSTGCRRAEPEEPQRGPTMGNLQSDGRKRTKKDRGPVDGRASTPGSVGDGLDEADTGEDAETGEADQTPATGTPDAAKPEERVEFEKVRVPKRQAPKPPGSAVRKVRVDAGETPRNFFHGIPEARGGGRDISVISGDEALVEF